MSLIFALVMIVVLLMSACGSESTKVEAPTTAASDAVGMDIESGCWRASDRAAGGDSVGQQQWKTAPAMVIDPAKKYTATIDTNKGSFEVQLDPADAPQTVNNFVCLANAGFYDGTPFHRIISGFMFQGGDPTGTGAGGPGYKFADEPITKNYVKGTLAMANAGPNTNGSQFFVCLDDLSAKGALAKNYTIFGQVVSGMDVVEAIGKTPVQTGRSGERSSPTEPVTLNKVTIAES